MQANCRAQIVTNDGKKKIVIYAQSAIAKDQEITYDYKFDKDSEGSLTCHCGAAKCRKFLNA